MLDSFLLYHREVVIQDDQRRFLEDFTFIAAGDLAAGSLDPPDRSFLEDSPSMGDHIAFYGIWVRRHLRKVHTQHRTQGMGRLPRLDEKLLQVILLHKLNSLLDPQDSALQSARSAVGTMIQRDLTLLLCEIRLEQWGRIFNLSRLRGMSARDWEIHIAGASAAAHTLMTLASRKGSRIYLPTAHEDVYQGIDLFWLEADTMYGISVKCVVGLKDPVRVWQVRTPPHNGNDDRVTADQRTIFQGVQRFASSEGRYCIPVLVYVAKPEGGPIRLNQNWNLQTWPDQILSSGTVQESTLNLAQ